MTTGKTIALTIWTFVIKVMSLVLCTIISHFSHVQLFVTLWTAACQSPLSTGFYRQEYWSGLPFPSPGYLPDPGIKTASPVTYALQAGPPGKFNFDVHISLVMLSTFSCASWLSVCFLEKMSIYVFYPFLKLSHLLFWYWVASVVCIFCIFNTLSIASLANIFSILRLVFLSCLWFPVLCKIF